MNKSERLVFSTSVEGLMKGMALEASVRAELRELGIDVDRPLLPAYPAELWHRALHLIAQRVHPTMSIAEAYRRMGERTVYGMEDTLLGRATLAMAKLVGPRRMLLRLPNSAKSGSNFARLEVQELSPTEFLLTSQPYMGYAEFMQGSVRAAIEICGAPKGTVEIVDHDRRTEQLVLRASWPA